MPAFRVAANDSLWGAEVAVANATNDQELPGVAYNTSAKNYIQSLAASKYVALKDRIMAGESVRQIADPYMQSYAKLLEVDRENVKLDDPLIQRALQARDAKGKPTTQTVYDFEQTLRNDARWRKTDNARDTGMAAASGLESAT